MLSVVPARQVNKERALLAFVCVCVCVCVCVLTKAYQILKGPEKKE